MTCVILHSSTKPPQPTGVLVGARTWHQMLVPRLVLAEPSQMVYVPHSLPHKHVHLGLSITQPRITGLLVGVQMVASDNVEAAPLFAADWTTAAPAKQIMCTTPLLTTGLKAAPAVHSDNAATWPPAPVLDLTRARSLALLTLFTTRSSTGLPSSAEVR